MRSANPVLSERTFARVQPAPTLRTPTAAPPTTMTIEGTVYKSAFLLLLVVGAAAFSWRMAGQGALLLPAVGVAFFLLLGLAVATAFRPQWAVVTGPIYALASGVVLGAVSALYNAAYEGLVGQAVLATFGTAGGMLLAYRSGAVRATPRFRRIVVSATLGIVVLYAVSIVMRLFGVEVPLLHDSGPLGIAVSLFIVAVAALNLVLDFDLIQRGAAGGADKRMEWFGAFALMVTLVWLYLEMLRLLAKLRR